MNGQQNIKKFKIRENLARITGTSYEDMGTYDYVAKVFLEGEVFLTEVIQKIKRNTLYAPLLSS